MIALQRMIIQYEDSNVYLLPAWPKEWNVRFKLYATQNTTVEGEAKDGKIIHLKVTPDSHSKKVELAKGWSRVEKY